MGTVRSVSTASTCAARASISTPRTSASRRWIRESHVVSSAAESAIDSGIFFRRTSRKTGVESEGRERWTLLGFHFDPADSRFFLVGGLYWRAYSFIADVGRVFIEPFRPALYVDASIISSFLPRYVFSVSQKLISL